MSEITRNQAIQIVEDIRTAISAGSVTNTMEAQVLEYCVSVLGRRIVEASLSGRIENLPDITAFLAGISPSATLKALLEGITDAVEVINANIGNGYVYAGIATPSGTPVSGKVFYLAKQAGQYANFGGLTVTEGVNILKRNGSTWTQEQLMSMADIYKNPLIGYYECDTAGDTSAKTVTAAGYVLPATGGSVKIKMANRNTVANATLNINSTGAKPLYYNGQRAGVGNTWDTNEIIEVFYDGTKYQAYNVAGCNGDGVFDISAYNLTDGQPTPYEDLAAALGTNGANVPESYRRGGMTVKYVQSSDNKYVQYRLMSDTFSTTESDWQGVDDVPMAGSNNLVESGGVAKQIIEVDNKISEGKENTYSLTNQGYIKIDGTIQPSQNGACTDYINLVGYSTLQAYTYVTNIAYAVALYDSEYNLLSDLSVVGIGASNLYTIDLTQTQYSNVVYAKVSAYDPNSDFSRFYAKILTEDGEIIKMIEELKTDRLEFGISPFGNFSVDTSNYPNVVLNTVGRDIYIYNGKRHMTFVGNMASATLTKTIGSESYSLWIIVYEPTLQIYNIYTRENIANNLVPANAVTLAVCIYKSVIFTASNFTFDGNPTGIKGNIDMLSQKGEVLANSLELVFKESSELVVTNWSEVGYARSSDGAISSSSEARHTRIDGLRYFSHMEVYCYLTNLGYAIAFYDKDGNILPNISVAGIGASHIYTLDLVDSDYADAEYAIVSCYDMSYVQHAYCKLTNKTVSERKAVQELGVSRFAKPVYDYNVILMYGQSLASGQQTCPPLSIVNYKGNLMIGKEWANGSSLNSMIAECPNYTQEQAEAAQKTDQELAESPGINLCNAIKYMIDDTCMEIVDRKVLIVNAAIGGQSIELLSKNCPNNSGSDYNTMLTKLNKAKNLSDAAGKTSGCIGIIWMQGEYNGRSMEDQGWTDGTAATSNKDDYKALLIGGTTSDSVQHNGLLPDIIADVKTIFGQSEQPVCICTQTAINTNKTIDMPIDMALLEASDEFYGLFMAGSSYSVPNRGTHLDPNGSRWVGEFLAKAYYNVIFKNIDYEPLRPTCISRHKNHLHIEYNNNTPLQFNTSILQKKTDYGFSVYIGGTKKNINTILLNGNSVDIYVEGNLDGTLDITYADMNVEYGNLCDCDEWKSFERYKELPSQLKPSYEPRLAGLSNLYNLNYPMFNFSVKWYYQIPDGQYFIKC